MTTVAHPRLDHASCPPQYAHDTDGQSHPRHGLPRTDHQAQTRLALRTTWVTGALLPHSGAPPHTDGAPRPAVATTGVEYARDDTPSTHRHTDTEDGGHGH